MKKTIQYTLVAAGLLGVLLLSNKLAAADDSTCSMCSMTSRIACSAMSMTTPLTFKLMAADSSAAAGASGSAGTNSALMEPVKSVYDHYLAIQKDLANDSLTGVAANATAMAKEVEGDSMKMLPAAVATEAQALGQAKDLESARAAFKPLSDDLIKYLADHGAKSAYVQVYCPMARASWLQDDKTVRNPYFGSAMSGCGVIQE
jgi:Cu(I)/Ag(I) efflux system membrane fusion protein